MHPRDYENGSPMLRNVVIHNFVFLGGGGGGGCHCPFCPCPFLLFFEFRTGFWDKTDKADKTDTNQE